MQTVKIFARHLPESCIPFGFPGDGARRYDDDGARRRACRALFVMGVTLRYARPASSATAAPAEEREGR